MFHHEWQFMQIFPILTTQIYIEPYIIKLCYTCVSEMYLAIYANSIYEGLNMTVEWKYMGWFYIHNCKSKANFFGCGAIPTLSMPMRILKLVYFMCFIEFIVDFILYLKFRILTPCPTHIEEFVINITMLPLPLFPQLLLTLLAPS